MPRRPHDFYETPPHYLKALESVLVLPENSRVIDACVGEGAIVKWVEQTYGQTTGVMTNDIDKKRKADYHFDACDPRLYEKVKCDWWITNPPFNIIDDILRVAITEVGNVITLARLSVLEPTEARREIYKYYQPDLLIVLPRYCFRLNDKGKPGNDSVTCAWVGWGAEVPRITTVWCESPPEEAKDKQ